jgi:hypothetical protein
MELRSTRFSTDLTGEATFFDGFTREETWNGFDCPYFTFEQGQRIVESTNEAAKEWQLRDPKFNTLHGRYDAQLDAFVFYYRQEADLQTPEQDCDIFYGEMVEGMKLYPIGTGSWAWTEEESS